jgi:hypothetical protein
VQVDLIDDELGRLELGCDPYVVTSLQIGSPAVRAVTRDRALADGSFDDTRFLGARAVTVAVTLKNGAAQGDMQSLIDRVVPYMSPRRRPLIAWQLPGSAETRAMEVRGESWPFTLEGPKFPTLGLQWVCPSGEIVGGVLDPLCTLITPGADLELGRPYPEDYADGGRSYPFSGTVGARIIENPGSAWANWTLSIFGAATGPRFTINGSTIEFDRGGNLVVGVGSSVVLDSRERTVLMNNDPANSVYYKTNYDEWSWDELRLHPGTNQVRFDGFSLGPTATAQLCFRPTYLA